MSTERDCNPETTVTPVQTPETGISGNQRDILELTHIVIEEVSIDGICGVY